MVVLMVNRYWYIRKYIRIFKTPSIVRRKSRRSGIINIENYQTRENKINKKIKSININELIEMFKFNTFEDCAIHFKVSIGAIRRIFKNNNINMSVHNHSKIAYKKYINSVKDTSFLTYEFLYKEYIVENKDSKSIAKDIGLHYNTVLKRIKKFGLIKSRKTISESLMIKHYNKTGYYWPGQRPDILEKIFKARSKFVYNPIKSNKQYMFKSLHELCYAMLLDNDNNVNMWNYENVMIPYIDDDGSNRLYYIDFDIRYNNGLIKWIEIKLKDNMIPINKLIYATKSAISSGIKFEGIDNKCREDGYGLFLSGYNDSRVIFKNPKELKINKKYTLWFKDNTEISDIIHDHYVYSHNIGRYIKYEFIPKCKNKVCPA